MPAGEQGDHQFFNDRVLADDDFAQLGRHLAIRLGQLLHRRQVVFGLGRGVGICRLGFLISHE